MLSNPSASAKPSMSLIGVTSIWMLPIRPLPSNNRRIGATQRQGGSGKNLLHYFERMPL